MLFSKIPHAFALPFLLEILQYKNKKKVGMV